MSYVWYRVPFARRNKLRSLREENEMKWTSEMLNRLTVEYPTADLKYLSSALGVHRTALKSKAKILGLRRSPDVRIWSPAIRKKLIELYARMKNAEIANILGFTEPSIGALAFKMNLHKDPVFMRECSSKGFFPKGHVPQNKGLKQVDYMSPEMIQHTVATRFHKNHVPHNHLQVGDECIVKGGYIKVKVADPKKWVYKQRLVWEKHNGPVPRGMLVQFKDRNIRNFDISNLYIVSRQEQIRSNTIQRYPEDIKSTIRIISKLKKTIKNGLKNYN